MSNKYRDLELSSLELAAIQTDIDRLKSGTWGSEQEMKAALRSPGYHVDGAIGQLYRHEWEAKTQRTLNTGVTIGNNRVVNKDGDHPRVAVKRNGATGTPEFAEGKAGFNTDFSDPQRRTRTRRHRRSLQQKPGGGSEARISRAPTCRTSRRFLVSSTLKKSVQGCSD